MNPIEETEKAVLTDLFRRFPERFVWIGGSVLHLLHHSPRSSLDLDLLPVTEGQNSTEIVEVVQEALNRSNAVLRTNFAIDEVNPVGEFFRIHIADGAASFSVDVTRIAGPAANTREVLVTSVLGTASVRVPVDPALLLQKLRALLMRRYPKPGDLFDAWFLINAGVRLRPNQAAMLRDEVHGSEAELEERFERFDRSPAAWVAALRRAGVTGLTPETAVAVSRTVRHYLNKVIS